MRNILIGICDNSNADTLDLIQHLNNAAEELNISLDIHTYTNDRDFLNAYHPVFDMIFLNLTLPDFHAKEIVSLLRQRDPQVHLILTSESSELATIGYEFNAKNHFVKPYWYFKILNELKRFLTFEHIPPMPYIWISDRKNTYKLYLHKLRYIETINRQLLFHYDDKQIVHHGKLVDFEHLLPSETFFRCNNSFLVNINYIDSVQTDISRYSIHLITGERIPLSRDKKRELLKMISITKYSL